MSFTTICPECGKSLQHGGDGVACALAAAQPDPKDAPLQQCPQCKMFVPLTPAHQCPLSDPKDALTRAVRGELSLDTLDAQFCSDWLKDELRKLLTERDQLKARVAELTTQATEVTTLRAELAAAKAAAGRMRAILQRIAEYGPPQGEKHDSIACPFCDMGEAGYATRGDGYHDDDCAIKDAQVLLEALDRETGGKE